MVAPIAVRNLLGIFPLPKLVGQPLCGSKGPFQVTVVVGLRRMRITKVPNQDMLSERDSDPLLRVFQKVVTNLDLDDV